MDGRTDRWTDRQTDGQSDGHALLQRCVDSSKNLSQSLALHRSCSHQFRHRGTLGAGKEAITPMHFPLTSDLLFDIGCKFPCPEVIWKIMNFVTDPMYIPEGCTFQNPPGCVRPLLATESSRIPGVQTHRWSNRDIEPFLPNSPRRREIRHIRCKSLTFPLP